MSLSMSILDKRASDVFNGTPDDPSIPDLLKLIEQSVPKVNAATDKVNALIRAVEHRLNEIGAGVWAYVEIGDWATGVSPYGFESHPIIDSMDGQERELANAFKLARLMYTRTDGGYRIVLREVASWADDSEEHGDVIFEKPLLECPRDKKLYAMLYLPELLFDIARRFRDMATITDSTATLGRVEEALKAIGEEALSPIAAKLQHKKTMREMLNQK